MCKAEIILTDNYTEDDRRADGRLLRTTRMCVVNFAEQREVSEFINLEALSANYRRISNQWRVVKSIVGRSGMSSTCLTSERLPLRDTFT